MGTLDLPEPEPERVPAPRARSRRVFPRSLTGSRSKDSRNEVDTAGGRESNTGGGSAVRYSNADSDLDFDTGRGRERDTGGGNSPPHEGNTRVSRLGFHPDPFPPGGVGGCHGGYAAGVGGGGHVSKADSRWSREESTRESAADANGQVSYQLESGLYVALLIQYPQGSRVNPTQTL